MQVQLLHHISLPVVDLERSRRFYREVMRLEEIPRPAFPFPGAWFRLGDRELHLIAGNEAHPRGAQSTNPRELHFAVRVASYREALEHLQAHGYHEDAPEHAATRLALRPRAVTGYPQIYILDPDRHLIEINADRLDLQEA